MIEKIDNFTITETSESVVVDYSKSAKDSFDAFFELIAGSVFSLFACLFIVTWYKFGFKSSSYLEIFIHFFLIIVFAFHAALKFMSGVSRFLQPTKSVLVIDKKIGKLISRKSPFTSKIIPLEVVRALVVCGHREKIAVGSGQKMTRYYCTIKIRLKNKEDEALLVINTDSFLNASSREIETEVYLKAKRLTSAINKHLKSKYQWTGFNHT